MCIYSCLIDFLRENKLNVWNKVCKGGSVFVSKYIENFLEYDVSLWRDYR